MGIDLNLHPVHSRAFNYEIIINKSQGQTFTEVGMYLPQSVFTLGQLYVAMLRFKS